MKIDVEYIAKLARIDLTKEEKEKFSKDLDKILDYFKELQEVDTEDVLPMFGGTDLVNVFRDDAEVEDFESKILRDAFPKQKDGYLKVPKIFS